MTEFDQFLQQAHAAPPEARPALVDRWLETIRDRPKPVVDDSQALFLYRGRPSHPPAVTGDFNHWNRESHPLIHLNGTDLYYLRVELPRDARSDYMFALGRRLVKDPLNPRTVTGGGGGHSELAMPGYRRPPEIEAYPNLPRGDLRKHYFSSRVLGNRRTLWVYLPPEYDETRADAYPVVFAHDGADYLNFAVMPRILDYCIGHGLIRPLVAVLAGQVRRNWELYLNDQYRDFFLGELVSYVQDRYRLDRDPGQRLVMGASLGGVTSLWLAYERPEVFGLAAGQSSALWIHDGWMIATLLNGPVKPVRFYLDCGSFEPQFAEDNRLLARVLQVRGYDSVYHEIHDGHAWPNWRDHVRPILERFFPVETRRERAVATEAAEREAPG